MRRKHFAPDGTKLVLKSVGENETCEGCYYCRNGLHACFRTDSPFKDNCTGKSFTNFIWVKESEEK